MGLRSFFTKKQKWTQASLEAYLADFRHTLRLKAEASVKLLIGDLSSQGEFGLTFRQFSAGVARFEIGLFLYFRVDLHLHILETPTSLRQLSTAIIGDVIDSSFYPMNEATFALHTDPILAGYAQAAGSLRYLSKEFVWSVYGRFFNILEKIPPDEKYFDLQQFHRQVFVGSATRTALLSVRIEQNYVAPILRLLNSFVEGFGFLSTDRWK